MNSLNITMPSIIRALGRGKTGTRDLTEDEAQFTMSSILDNTITGPQLGAFLMLMRVKEETAAELSGMVKACEQALKVPKQNYADVNWPAYAGKKRQPSWYILAAKLLAKNGVRVLMHGGGEHTQGRQYARAVCEGLGLPIAQNLMQATAQIADKNFSYISIEYFLPRLSELIDMKAELGLRSPVNTVVRHLNPLGAPVTLQGMFHPAYMPLHHETAKLLQQNNNVVLKGDGGEFEVRPDSETAIAVHSQENLSGSTIAPVLNLRSIRPETAELEPLLGLWEGSSPNKYGEAAVVQTTAVVLSQLRQISFSDAVTVVNDWWKKR